MTGWTQDDWDDQAEARAQAAEADRAAYVPDEVPVGLPSGMLLRFPTAGLAEDAVEVDRRERFADCQAGHDDPDAA